MDKAKRARTAETPKQPSLGLQLRAPYLYPDRTDTQCDQVLKNWDEIHRVGDQRLSLDTNSLPIIRA
jgi:hypothetical protein